MMTGWDEFVMVGGTDEDWVTEAKDLFGLTETVEAIFGVEER